jgi:penicillin amidase
LYDELDFENTTDLEYPSPWTTIALVKSNPNHQIWDNAETPAQDTAASIIRLSLGSATDRFNKLEKQDWASVRDTRITHIIPSLESFGHYNISAGGSPSSPNALRDTKGPSWRMIIDVQKNPKALAVYPGGQSGHPGSKYYDNLLDAWAKGEYYEMQAAPVPDELTTPFFTLQSISHEAE